MFVPALVAICLRRFVFHESPINRRHYGERPGWVLHGFLILFLVQVGAAIMAVATDAPGWLVNGTGTWSMILWTLVFIRLYRKQGEESFGRAGLQLGRVDLGFRIALGFVFFLVLQGALDLLFGLGRNLLGTVPGIAAPLPEGAEPAILIVAFLLSIVGTPLGSLALLFGEEYGWRGYLQDALAPVGRRSSALMIGLVWGIWHIPIIMSGVHTYPPTATGFLVAFVFFSLWGFVQSFAVWKTGSIWTAAVLHGIVNGLYGFIRTFVVRPDDKLLSFGLGLYGVICLFFVVVFIWRGPVWDARPRERKPAT